MFFKKVRTLLCMTIIAGLLAVTGCAGGSSGNGGQKTASQEASGNGGADAAGQETSDQQAAEDMEIKTKYGMLHYPDQWREFAKIEQSEEGDVVSVSFTAVINENEYPLFTVNIGGGDGSEVGKLTDAEGKERIVYINASEIKEEEALDANEQNRLYAMQEDINYVVDHLK